MDLLWPLHPKLVHFPIALMLSALMLEAMSWVVVKDRFHQAAVTCFVMAALFSFPTVLSGQAEESRLRLHHPLLETHEQYALIFMYGAMGGGVLLGIFKKFFPSFFRPVFISFILVLSIIVAMAAFYGGQMVYEYGVGVKG